MDPQACFNSWLGAVEAGEYEEATNFQVAYENWCNVGGFKARDKNGASVEKLDLESDRFLVIDDGVEKWRKVSV